MESHVSEDDDIVPGPKPLRLGEVIRQWFVLFYASYVILGPENVHPLAPFVVGDFTNR